MFGFAVTIGFAFLLLQGTVPDPLAHLISSAGLGGVMFYFYRRDILGKKNEYETIIKDNTEALTRLAVMIGYSKGKLGSAQIPHVTINSGGSS